MKRNQRTLYRSIFFLCLFIAIVIIVCTIFFNINIILGIILDIIGLLVLGVAAFFTLAVDLLTMNNLDIFAVVEIGKFSKPEFNAQVKKWLGVPTSALDAIVCIRCGYTTFYARNPSQLQE